MACSMALLRLADILFLIGFTGLRFFLNPLFNSNGHPSFIDKQM
jgi:hypothetical protein